MAQNNINSLDDLRLFAKDFCAQLKPGTVVALVGPLGAGKTTLVQMIALELGITARVTSPTFALVKEYEVPNKARKISRMYHIDLYRLDRIDDDLGFEEYFADIDSVVFVEWAEKAKHILPASAVWLEILVKNNSKNGVRSRFFGNKKNGS